jgi:hypothetical protein
VALDTKHKASDWCLIFYALNFFLVLVVFTYQLKLYPSIAPMIVMLTEGVKDVNFFVAAQMVFTLLFGLLFYIFGVTTEDSDDYSQLSIWGTFL